MASVTMECPVCTLRRIFRDGEPYTQKDLYCPNDEAALVAVTTSSEPTPEPELPLGGGTPGDAPADPSPADAPPAEPEPEPIELEPLSPEALAQRLTKIMALEKEIRDAEIVQDRKKKQHKDATAEVEAAKAALLAYIRQCRVPKILPLFDGVAAAPPTEEGAADLAGLAMQQIIDGQNAITTSAAVDLEGEIENHIDDDVPPSELEQPEPARQPRRRPKA